MCLCSLLYPARNVHAPYYIVMCGLSGYTKLFNVMSKTANVSEKLLDIKCVFSFSLQILSETFLILRKSERDIIKKLYFSLRKITFILVRF